MLYIPESLLQMANNAVIFFQKLYSLQHRGISFKVKSFKICTASEKEGSHFKVRPYVFWNMQQIG